MNYFGTTQRLSCFPLHLCVGLSPTANVLCKMIVILIRGYVQLPSQFNHCQLPLMNSLCGSCGGVCVEEVGVEDIKR